jgi:hypothetical protein
MKRSGKLQAFFDPLLDSRRSPEPILLFELRDAACKVNCALCAFLRNHHDGQIYPYS